VGQSERGAVDRCPKKGEKNMKAIVYTKYGTPDVLQLKEVEKPEPGPLEVLIRVHASAVTATDPIDRKGEPFIARVTTGIRGPKNATPGGVLAGEIEAVGEGVRRFKKGDRVYGSTGIRLGAHAEYISLPETAALAGISTNLSFGEAAAVCDGALTALPFLRDHGKIRPGSTVLVNGASGSVGTAAVQLARHFGAQVTGVCSRANAGMVASLGAHQVIDYTREDFTRLGPRYDIIFDAVGKRSFSACKSALNDNGIYLTTVPSLAILGQMLWTTFRGGKKAVFAATGLRPKAEKADDLGFINQLLEAGELTSVIDRHYPLTRIAEAHRYVERGHKKGNVLLTL
jgi:NADPH:quinone reductase-like Zn-dependent oxidoreductase